MRKTSLLNTLLTLLLLSIQLVGNAAGSGRHSPQLAQNDSWESLSPSQKQVLAPLANEWNNFLPDRKQKWIVMSNKFQKMNPDEQKRIQEKMQAWTRLTPAQRAAARENYLLSNKVQPDQRNQQWQQYQQLTEEQKARLAQSRGKKNLITNLPTPAESKIPPLQPLKKPRGKNGPAS